MDADDAARAYRARTSDGRLSDEQVTELWLRGRRRWPDLPSEPVRFGQLLAARGEETFEALADAAADVVIVAACAAGHSVAISAFERRYFGAIAGAVASMRLGDDLVDEITQDVRRRLFVASSQEAPIERYVGRGDLAGLVRTVAVRAALNRIRAERTRPGELSDDDADRLDDALDDPELLLLRGTQQTEVKAAFAAALGTLEPRQRTLLRLQLVDGLSIDEVGALFGVHRATAARWLARARESVASRTRDVLARKLELEGQELDALLAVIRSRLELSLSRLLASGRPDRSAT